MTIIDGGGNGTVVSILGCEQKQCSLQGFTLQNGSGELATAVYILTSSPTVTGNIVDGNTIGTQGAVSVDDSSPVIEKNLFRNCSCMDNFASGVVNFGNTSSPIVTNNLFFNNPCRAISVSTTSGTSPQVANNTIVGNRSRIGLDGAALAALHLYKKNIIVGNNIGFEIQSGTLPSDSIWKNNLVYGNSTNYSGGPDLTGINGNISADPLFFDEMNNNFHLCAWSPAIGAGDASSLSLPATDFDGNPRVVDGRLDIGVYEFTPGPLPPVPSFDYFGFQEGNHLESLVTYTNGSTGTETDDITLDTQSSSLLDTELLNGDQILSWLQVTPNSLGTGKQESNGVTVTYAPALPMVKLPLAAKMRWTATSTASEYGVAIHAKLTAKVSPQVLVSVPAGYFMAWPIAYNLTASARGRTVSTKWTTWFAPYIGTVITKDSTSTTSLTAFSVGGGTVGIPLPVVTGIYPASATAGSTVTINGFQFGSSQGSSVVRIGSVNCDQIMSWTDTQIQCIVPDTASSGAVIVVTDTWTSIDSVILKIPPQITSVAPSSGTRRSTVQIAGTHFGAVRGKVKFGSVRAAVTQWSDTSITCIVPATARMGTCPVSVINSQGQSVLQGAFTVVK